MGSSEKERTLILKADLLITPSEAIEGGAMLVRGKEIGWIGRWKELEERGGNVLDLTGCVVVPGLINCHCHLELSALSGGKVDRGSSFTDWILNLLKARKGWDKRRYRESARKGVEELIRYGTTTVADITNSGESFGPLLASGIRAVVFYELIGLDPIGSRARMAMAMIWLRRISEISRAYRSEGLIPGLSPHAPYSTSGWLYGKAIRLSELRGIPIATHISETEEEVELLLRGTGPLRSLVDMIPGARWCWSPPGMSPIRYLFSLGYHKTKGLLVHANYLSEEDLQAVALSGCPVVYCPRSASFFGHDSHPIEGIMRAGGRVVLGTDSLASNESLSMIEEMREVLRRHSSIPPYKVLEMATEEAALSLGLGARLGRLGVGMRADVSAFEIENSSLKDPYLILIEGTKLESAMTMVDGKIIL
jgi:cytosine/adenosine deaminase-related metal-dependent hydrolase